MRCVVQISDLHFGHNDPALLEPLRKSIIEVDPQVLVVSGDLVEHASDSEFQAAKEFLASLPCPQLVVPGNHDLPFWNVPLRIWQRLSKFRHYITRDAMPEFIDDEIAVLGADSAHLFPVKGGRITSLQLQGLKNKFSSYPEGLVRLLVTHHPFDLPDPANPHLIMGHAESAIKQLAPVVDVLLAGHIHVSSNGSTSTRYKAGGRSMVFVQAGTAISSRYKGEANSFNVLRVGRAKTKEKQVVVDRHSWMQNQACFQLRDSTEFLLGKEGWTQVPQTPAK